MSWLKEPWCKWTHGGIVMHDPSGKINWQCVRCGRWGLPWEEPKKTREELVKAVEDASDNWTAAVVIALGDTADTRDAFIAAKDALIAYDKENT